MRIFAIALVLVLSACSNQGQQDSSAADAARSAAEAQAAADAAQAAAGNTQSGPGIIPDAISGGGSSIDPAAAAANAAAEAANAAAAAADAPSIDADASAEALSFDGNDCTEDCSGHQAGYDWAEQHEITDPDDCGGNSQSFIEGCESYAEEQQDGAG